MSNIAEGVIPGKTIELQSDLGFEEGLDQIQRERRLRASIDELRAGLFDDEQPPSEQAVNGCVALMRSVLSPSTPGQELPFPQLATSGDGDLTCEWPWGDRRVTLSLSRDGATTLRQFEQQSTTREARHQRDPDASDVKAALAWLTSPVDPR